jgi:hypothetical protein
LAHYPLLQETPSRDPAERTRWNVRDRDATLILVDRGGLTVSGGTQRANAIADELGKPWIALDVAAPDSRESLRAWLAAVKHEVLSSAVHARARRRGFATRHERCWRQCLGAGDATARTHCVGGARGY